MKPALFALSLATSISGCVITSERPADSTPPPAPAPAPTAAPAAPEPAPAPAARAPRHLKGGATGDAGADSG